MHNALPWFFWAGLAGFIALTIMMIVLGIRQALVRNQIQLLAQDMHTHGADTISSSVLRCQCCNRRTALSHYLYGHPERTTLLCKQCTRTLNTHIVALSQDEKGDPYRDDEDIPRHARDTVVDHSRSRHAAARRRYHSTPLD